MNEQYKEPLLFEEFPPVSAEEWHQVIINDLKGADFDKKLIWKTYEGMSVMPFYRQEDLSSLEHLRSLPGQAPFTRGNNSVNNSWIIRQDISITDIVKANIFAQKAVENGATAIGFNVSNIQDTDSLKALLHNLNLPVIQVHFTHAASFSKFLELFLQYLDNQKIDKTKIQGSFQYCPLNELITTGQLQKPWNEITKEAAAFIKNVQHHLPGFRSLNIPADIFHNTGSSLVQELGYGLSLANEYLASLTEEGLSVDEISKNMLFTFAVGSDYFPEIAKIRAARYLWHQLTEQYHPAKGTSLQMFIHSTTSTWNKTLFDPYVNLLRTTTETMSAAIAGSEIISVEPFDGTFKEADEFSLRLARNQQIILQQESYLNKIVDPAAGSYYIEKLTDEIARLSWGIFKETETFGGFIHSFLKNIIQDAIEKVSSQKKIDIANRKITFLGVNQYPNHTETMLDKAVDLAEKNTSTEQPVKGIRPGRGAEAIELLRLATEKHLKKTAGKPTVFLFNIGNLAMRKARATFSSNFFGCAGYKIIDNSGFTNVEEGIASCLKLNPEITVICSSDEEYPSLVPAICSGLKEKGYNGIFVLAGYPKDIIQPLQEAGIHEFIHVRTNLLDSLRHFHQLLGISF